MKNACRTGIAAIGAGVACCIASAAWFLYFGHNATEGNTGEKHMSSFSVSAHRGPVRVLAYSPAGDLAASGGEFDGLIRIWDPATGEAKAVLHGDGSPVTGLAFARGGLLIATFYRGSICLWDTSTWNRVAALRGADTSSLALFPDGRTFAVGGDLGDASITMWDVDTLRGRLFSRLKDPGDTDVAAASFSPDGATLATTGEGENKDEVILWSVKDARRTAVIRHLPYLTPRVLFSPDGRHLAIWAGNPTVSLWDPRQGQISLTIGEGEGIIIMSVCFSPNGKLLATVGSSSLTVHGRGEVRLWEVASGRLVSRFHGEDGPLTCVAFSPDGERLLVGNVRGGLEAWNVSQ